MLFNIIRALDAFLGHQGWVCRHTVQDSKFVSFLNVVEIGCINEEFHRLVSFFNLGVSQMVNLHFRFHWAGGTRVFFGASRTSYRLKWVLARQFLGIKNGKPNIAPLQPPTLATFRSWGSSAGAGRAQLASRKTSTFYSLPCPIRPASYKLNSSGLDGLNPSVVSLTR